ncbi:MAG: hypothetical protein PUF72_11980, partial [Clostridiales bacterium]|nr:hypothetical protein [Clostridiales bacterium]
MSNSVTDIDWGAFFNCTGLTDVYYSGTEEQWKNISIASYNDCLKNATIHYKPWAYTINTVTKSSTGVTVNLTQNSAAEGRLIIAAYDDSGALVRAVVSDIFLSAGETSNVDVSMDTSGAVRAFVWDLGTQTPFAECK